MKKRIKKLVEKFMKKPLKVKISVILAAVFIFVAVFWGMCELFGSPVAKIRVISAANDYIDENMPGMERSRSLCKYDRERDIYYIDFTPEGRKNSFRLEFREDGRLTKDGFTLDYMYDGLYGE